ncbi:MAG TPA: hypothetical protein VFU19_16240 [Iamia sp.]|nr:hypothetical protein [Iamia sp.]
MGWDMGSYLWSAAPGASGTPTTEWDGICDAASLADGSCNSVDPTQSAEEDECPPHLGDACVPVTSPEGAVIGFCGPGEVPAGGACYRRDDPAAYTTTTGVALSQTGVTTDQGVSEPLSRDAFLVGVGLIIVTVLLVALWITRTLRRPAN